MESARLWLLFHFASGQAYFSGAGIMLAAIGLSPWIRSRWLRSLRMGAVILAAALTGLSAVPLSWISYFALVVVSMVWLIYERIDRDQTNRRLSVTRWIAAILWTVAVLAELPSQFAPTIPSSTTESLEIIGDSITAGAGEPGIVRWPELLATDRAVVVADHAQMGATAKKALKQAARLGSGRSLVVVEIGGNDLLGTTTPGDFEQDLRQLLSQICQPGRVVVMFELPLPPFYNHWGRIQRRAARDFGVRLIPRRVLAGVLLVRGNTSDSIHLTQAGQSALAGAVWQIVGESLTVKP